LYARPNVHLVFALAGDGKRTPGTTDQTRWNTMPKFMRTSLLELLPTLELLPLEDVLFDIQRMPAAGTRSKPDCTSTRYPRLPPNPTDVVLAPLPEA
jgi:hypothetical protein